MFNDRLWLCSPTFFDCPRCRKRRLSRSQRAKRKPSVWLRRAWWRRALRKQNKLPVIRPMRAQRTERGRRTRRAMRSQLSVQSWNRSLRRQRRKLRRRLRVSLKWNGPLQQLQFKAGWIHGSLRVLLMHSWDVSCFPGWRWRAWRTWRAGAGSWRLGGFIGKCFWTDFLPGWRTWRIEIRGGSWRRRPCGFMFATVLLMFFWIGNFLKPWWRKQTPRAGWWRPDGFH